MRLLLYLYAYIAMYLGIIHSIVWHCINYVHMYVAREIYTYMLANKMCHITLGWALLVPTIVSSFVNACIYSCSATKC